MEENGVLQSEMNQKLLQKIEELTLYVIEQNKRLERMDKENQDIKKENLDIRTKSLEQQKEIDRIKQLNTK